MDYHLTVGRPYLDMPADWHWMGKSRDRVDRRLIDLQKQFARDLLTHVNPHTGVAYKDEPAIAVVEINNENSILQTGTGMWFKFAGLDERFSLPIRTKWNAWLQKRYGTNEKMLAAWRGNANAEAGPEILRPGLANFGAEWSGGAAGTLEEKSENGATFLRWNPTKTGSQSWNIQLHQGNVPIEGGQTMRLQFRARADAPRSLGAVLMQSEAPWNSLFPGIDAQLTTAWKTFDYTLEVGQTGGKPIRLSFNTNNQTGVFDLSDVSLKVGGNFDLPVGATLENSTIPLVEAGQNPRMAADYTLFIGELDRQYSREMRAFLKEEIGVKSLVWDTQVNYGGAQGLLRESEQDALDMHTYPAHPDGLKIGENWMWRVQPKSLLGEGLGGLSGLTQTRLKGKPFFVTEFDINPPSDFASESYPMLALFSAYQGVAGFGEYSWLNFQKDYNPTRIQSAFGTTGHTGQMAFMPTAALLFRLGLVREAGDEALLQTSEGAILSEPVDWLATYRPWEKVGLQDGQGWTRRFSFSIQKGDAAPTLAGRPFEKLPPQARTILKSDTGEIEPDRRVANAETLILNAPAVRYAFGFTGGRDFQIGDVRLQIARGTLRNYGNFSVVSLDGKPISGAKKLLVTAVARTENKGQKFDAARTTSGFDWGEGPVLAEPLTFSLDVPGANWRASALDGNGRVARKIEVSRVGKNSRLRGEPAHQTVWYLLER